MYRDTIRSICRLASPPKSNRTSFVIQARHHSTQSSAQSQTKPINKATRSNLHVEPLCNCDDPNALSKCSKSLKCQYRVDQVPVNIKTYGCQMNANDTSIVSAILKDYGYKIVPDESQAEIQLLMTCAIRESAENKIWGKLHDLKFKKESKAHPLKQVGLLGCMAERLKEKVLQTSNSVDIVAGPDAYRDLPRLFAVNKMTDEKAVNCLLSFDETYSDIRPVTSINEVSSFISITRGCDNLCSYCIVPFTRGRERSRPLTTIVDEAKSLFERGIREVTLLGQNVNSYRDTSTLPAQICRDDLSEEVRMKEHFAEGFKTVYKPRTKGLTFDILLEEVAKISPELRVRFTSPHPKDFTDEVIDVISRYPNISRCIHLPAQSGSDSVLERMRRGYTKQAYLDLVERMRNSIPNLALTSDFITGFCGETDEDHEQTIDLIKKVRYNYIYSFPYSMRDKTHAFHQMKDDIPREIKVKRHQEVTNLFRQQATEINRSLVGGEELVLVETVSRRSDDNLRGRVDSNTKTVLPKSEIFSTIDNCSRHIRLGDYVVCSIADANSQTLFGKPLYITSQFDYHHKQHKRMSHLA